MNAVLVKALEAITARTNLTTGLTHPNNKNAAKEMFFRLHDAGEILLASEISAWAEMNGWQPEDAKELGALAEQIGMGKSPRIGDGPWWKDDIVEQLRSQVGDSA